jgi:transposase
MDARTVINLSPAATHDGVVRVLIAIELSKRSWIVAVNTPLSEKISNHTVKGWKELLELIDKIRTRVGRELKRPVEVVSCYEAGYDGFWVHRLLEENRVRNYVIDPASLQVDRRARRVKTDNVDVTKLLRSLMAYLRGEPKVWSVLRIPTIAEEDDRRGTLVRARSPTGYKLVRRVSHSVSWGFALDQLDQNRSSILWRVNQTETNKHLVR